MSEVCCNSIKGIKHTACIWPTEMGHLAHRVIASAAGASVVVVFILTTAGPAVLVWY